MSHTAELIAVGTELLLGEIANTDAQVISRGLSELGINVFYHTVVGDNPQRLRRAVDIAKGRADVILTTGGLGPTCDDLTKTVLSAAFGKELVYNEEAARRIEDYFARSGRTLTENNYQQAYLPTGCTPSRTTGAPPRAAVLRLTGCGWSCSPAPPASAVPCSGSGPCPISPTWPTESSTAGLCASSAGGSRRWRPCCGTK